VYRVHSAAIDLAEVNPCGDVAQVFGHAGEQGFGVCAVARESFGAG